MKRPFPWSWLLLAACQQTGGGSEVLVLAGPANVAGVETAFRIEIGPGGGWRWSAEGPLGGEWASDGTRVWERAWANPPRELHGSERELLLAQVAALRGDEFVDGGAFELERDGASGRVRSLMRREEGALSGIVFEDWIVRAGATVPARILRGDLDGVYDVYEVGEITREPARPFNPPAAPPHDWRFDAGVPAELEVTVATTGHLLVHPQVDGEDAGWFIFDSGAGAMCLDMAAAERLGLERFGRVTAVGVSGRVETGFARSSSWTLGPLTIERPVFVLLDLEFLSPLMGFPIAGIVGHEVFMRAIVEWDAPPAPRIALHPRDGYDAESPWSELRLQDRLPIVRARFEGGREDWFRLDTGANGTVAFHGPAVRRFGLLSGRETSAGLAAGVGGAGAMRVGRIEWFEIGGRRFESLPAQFYVGETGAFADEDSCGNVGLDVLREFRLVFDASGGRIAFQPRH